MKSGPRAVGLGASGTVYFGANLEFPGNPLSQSVSHSYNKNTRPATARGATGRQLLQPKLGMHLTRLQGCETLLCCNLSQAKPLSAAEAEAAGQLCRPPATSCSDISYVEQTVLDELLRTPHKSLLEASSSLMCACVCAVQVHGEQFLMANLVLHNEHSLHSLAISAAPCGHCRQFYSELGCAVSGIERVKSQSHTKPAHCPEACTNSGQLQDVVCIE